MQYCCHMVHEIIMKESREDIIYERKYENEISILFKSVFGH